MLRDRLKFALERLGPEDWHAFEGFASTFLTREYPKLRTLAVPGAGDEGRDAVLFSPEGDASVVLQYSVTARWDDKIRRTAKRLREAGHEARFLVYATNQVVGATADELRRDLRRREQLSLDVCDANYFIDRCELSRATTEASEGLAQRFVDPLLAERRLTAAHADHLSSVEARAACVYLAMQREDDARDKGLTKTAFDALVRASLRDATPEEPRSRLGVHAAVLAAVPSQDPEQVVRFVDIALSRMQKKQLHHYRDEDTFCLTAAERGRIADRLAEMAVHDGELAEEALAAAQARMRVHNVKRRVPDRQLRAATLELIDRYLFQRGESFVQAVRTGEFPEVDADVLRPLATNLLAAPASALKVLPKTHVEPVIEAAGGLLERPGAELRRHMRHFADAYILFAFLRETPDVQSVVSKLFSSGELWLDTNVLIRMLAEQLVEPEHRRYCNLLNAARRSGMSLRLTEGVLEEVEAHTFLSLRYARNDETATPWRGGVPFLFTAFALTGRRKGEFASWVETFRGHHRALDDLADYLRLTFGILVEDLQKDAELAPIDVRGAVKEFWTAVHENRHRTPMKVIDQARKDLLIAHDVETYLGVLYRRKRTRDSAFGYSTWWFTLDRAAYDVGRETGLARRWSGRFQTPVMSPDFLSAYLAVGPVRDKVDAQSSERLPLVLDLGQLDVTPPEFVSLGEEMRSALSALPEHVIRRRVRDGFDVARAHLGPVARGGVKRMLDEIRPILMEDARS